MAGLPLKLGEPSAFDRVRAFLDSCGYTSDAAAERIGFPRLDQLNQPALCDYAQRERNLSLQDPLGAVVKLFLCGQCLARGEAQALIPAETLTALGELGLIESEGANVFSPVLLFPAFDLYLTSDRYLDPDGTPTVRRNDFVYFPLQTNTSDFMAAVLDSPCESFLDLGGGCGVAGLWAAKKFANNVWSTDVNPRATHFAEFNRRLNGIANATVSTGDLYAPVEGRQFDRIACHPPYGASARPGYIYADGGEDGEALLRRVIEEAPRRLAPGGVLISFQVASDRKGEPLEARARKWLAAHSTETDVAAVVEQFVEPLHYAAASLAGEGAAAGAMAEWREMFARHRIEQMVYGALYLRRHPAPGLRPFTARRMRSSETTRTAIESMMVWESMAAQPDRDAVLRGARFRSSAHAGLSVTHRFRDGSLQPVEYTLRTDTPFAANMSCRAWVARLFSRCDGTRTGADLLAEAMADPEPVLDALAAMISGGFIHIETSTSNPAAKCDKM